MGHRLQWTDLPEVVRTGITVALGASVVDAVGQAGGYGPGLAARCGLADGRRVFIKAVSPAQNPDTPNIMRREARVVARLPARAPAPKLLHTIDDGTWIALVFEEVDGSLPRAPWHADELQRVVAAIVELGAITAPPGLPTFVDRYRTIFTGWRTLAAEEGAAMIDPWCAEHVDELAAMEGEWEGFARGTCLVHGDVRSDNLLLAADGRVVFVDWASACTGHWCFDLLAMLPSVQLEGGPPPEAVVELAHASGMPVLPSELLRCFVCTLAGYFAERGRLPDPPGLPTVREFQRAQASVAIAWLRRVLTSDVGR